MKKETKTGFLRGMTALLASLFGLMLCLTSIGQAYAGAINTHLGTASYMVEKTGEDTTDSNHFKSEFQSLGDLVAAKHELAVQLAAEGSVLLKNENKALPLSPSSEKVTVWGMNSLIPTLGGLIGSSVSTDSANGQTSVGIIDALAAKGFQLNNDMTAFYGSDACSAYLRHSSFFGNEVPGHALIPSFSAMYEEANSYMIGEPPASIYTQEVLDSAKDTTALVFLTRDSSEAADYSTSMSDPAGDSYTVPLALSEYERQLIELAKANSNGKVIVLLNSDMTMEIEELKQDPDIDAILWVGLPGVYGFEGVAQVIAGEVSPSGHLIDTYAVNSLSSPAMQNFGVYTYDNCSVTSNSPLTDTDKGDWYTVETEGIYIGYKYYETRYEDTVLNQGQATSGAGAIDGSAWDYTKEVSYPFGYGMSYTTFEQQLESVNVEIGGVSTATVKVTNTGDVAGKDVVQLYVQAPYTAGGLEKAAIQLISFGKTEVLQPGESAEVELEFDAQYFASYDSSCMKADGTQGAWVLDAGDYYFAIGNGAHEALNNVLANKLGNDAGLQTINEGETINGSNAIRFVLEQTDSETYSAGVENALQDCDLNYYVDGAAEYTTRADWTKGWETVTGISVNDAMLTGLKNQLSTMSENSDVDIQWGVDSGMTLADMMILDEETGAITGVVDLEDPLWDTLIAQITLEEAANYIERAGDGLEIINSIGLSAVYENDGPLGFTYDQVAGYGVRWNDSLSDEATYVSADDEYASWAMCEMPTEPVVAATFNRALVEREGQLVGEDALWANETGIYAPGMNLHRAAYCARNHEYYSEDAMVTNYMGTAFSAGARSKGMLTIPKHLAMNHQESNRSGVSTFFAEQAARENELRAFQSVLSSNLAGGVMTAFNRIGVSYAGGHTGLLQQILRNEWGYTGYVLSDMINGADYMNWRDLTINGNSLCLTSDAYSNSNIGSMTSSDNLKAIEKDAAFQAEMRESLKYALYTMAGSNAMNGMSADTIVVKVMPWWEKALVGADIALGALAVAAFAGCIVTVRKAEHTEK